MIRVIIILLFLPSPFHLFLLISFISLIPFSIFPFIISLFRPSSAVISSSSFVSVSDPSVPLSLVADFSFSYFGFLSSFSLFILPSFLLFSFLLAFPLISSYYSSLSRVRFTSALLSFQPIHLHSYVFSPPLSFFSLALLSLPFRV